MDEATINGHLVATVDKRALLEVLKKWRQESKTGLEANAFRDVIHHIESVEVDG